MASSDRNGKQTDYGRIYFGTPKEVVKPSSTEDLARTLRKYHEKGEPVTIRNTAHSTNGQTLTNGVEVSIGSIETLRFDKNAMKVTAGAGNDWNSVLKGIGFPKYCTPLFPNNPGQMIQIGGTAAVGGVGYYGSAVGGFWNHVHSLKLVTMTGEIIECSRAQNFDLLKYALGGFGRIGVISEVTVDVVESKPRVLGMVLAYRDSDAFQDAFARALNDPRFNGVAAQEDISNWQTEELHLLGINLKLLLVIVEMDDQSDLKGIVREIRNGYPNAITLFLEEGSTKGTLDVTLAQKTFSKEKLVYFYPSEESFLIYLCNRVSMFLLGRRLCYPKGQGNYNHPWCDCVIERKHYTGFVIQAKTILSRYGLAKHLEKQSMFHGLINIDSFVTFGIKRASPDPANFYPVALDLPQELQHSLGVAIMPNLPPDLLGQGLAMTKELSDLVYSLDGRRYLYGVHQLSRDQIEKHFGRNFIQRWQQIKDQLDPKHLLNIGVIEHLDA